MKTAIQVVTLALVLFLLDTVDGDEKPQPKEPPVETTAEEIATDFAKFPAEAAKMYADKQLRIKGEVEKVDGKNVHLKHDRANGGVFVILQAPNVPTVTVGEQVQAVGSMTAVFAGSVFFKCMELKRLEPILAKEQNGPAAVQMKGRPALAIRVDVQDKEAKLTIALDYLQEAKDVPRFQGVRFYTDLIRLEDNPARIGWMKGTNPQSVLLQSKKYVYTRAETDRQENGSVSITRQAPDAYRLVGVYHYLEQLFVIDAVLKSGEPLLLFETPGAGRAHTADTWRHPI